MPLDPSIHHRRSLRLRTYDYSQAGAYFVTICVHSKECLLGDVVEGEMRPNRYGHTAVDCWTDLPHHYPNVELDAFVIMPNHVHGILVLVDPNATDDWAGLKLAPTQTECTSMGARPKPGATGRPLSEAVRAFKTFSARRINEQRHTPGIPVWQRNFYEHVIRDEKSLEGIRDYIAENPLRWDFDELHPSKNPRP